MPRVAPNGQTWSHARPRRPPGPLTTTHPEWPGRARTACTGGLEPGPGAFQGSRAPSECERRQVRRAIPLPCSRAPPTFAELSQESKDVMNEGRAERGSVPSALH